MILRLSFFLFFFVCFLAYPHRHLVAVVPVVGHGDDAGAAAQPAHPAVHLYLGVLRYLVAAAVEVAVCAELVVHLFRPFYLPQVGLDPQPCLFVAGHGSGVL